jgi:hypothetical protein
MQAEEDIIIVHRVHTVGVFEEKLLLLGMGRTWEVRQPGHQVIQVTYGGQEVPYLDVGYPQEADVEHAVGHETRQVQGQEVKAQTNDTVGRG